jgi:hypothetical protein
MRGDGIWQNAPESKANVGTLPGKLGIKSGHGVNVSVKSSPKLQHIAEAGDSDEDIQTSSVFRLLLRTIQCFTSRPFHWGKSSWGELSPPPEGPEAQRGETCAAYAPHCSPSPPSTRKESCTPTRLAVCSGLTIAISFSLCGYNP